MANRQFVTGAMAIQRGLVTLAGKHTTTTTGALSTTASAFSPLKQAGYTLSKVPATAGRYLVTLQDKYLDLFRVVPTVSITGGAAYPIANGLEMVVRDPAVSAAVPVFTIQFRRTDTGADAEVPDGAIIGLEMLLKNSSV